MEFILGIRCLPHYHHYSHPRYQSGGLSGGHRNTVAASTKLGSVFRPPNSGALVRHHPNLVATTRKTVTLQCRKPSLNLSKHKKRKYATKMATASGREDKYSEQIR